MTRRAQFWWWLDSVLHRWRWTERLGRGLCLRLEEELWETVDSRDV